MKGCGATCHGAMCQSIRHMEQPRTCLAATPSPPLPNKSLCWRKPEALNLSRSLFFSPCCCRQLCVSLPLPPGRPASRGGPRRVHASSRNYNQKGFGRLRPQIPALARPSPCFQDPPWPGFSLFLPPALARVPPMQPGEAPAGAQPRGAGLLPSFLPSPQLSGFLSADTAPAGCCSTQPTPPAPGQGGPGGSQRAGIAAERRDG